MSQVSSYSFNEYDGHASFTKAARKLQNLAWAKKPNSRREEGRHPVTLLHIPSLAQTLRAEW